MFPDVPAAASTFYLMCHCQTAAAGSLLACLAGLRPHMQLQHSARGQQVQVRAMMLTLRANPTVKPPTPSPVTRGLVSTPNVPSREKPPSVYIAMAADFEANLQICLVVLAQHSITSQQLVTRHRSPNS